MKKFLLFFLAILLFPACSGKDSLKEDLAKRYEKATEYYEKEKWQKAKLEFDFIVMNNPGSRLALDAQFYLGECLFNLEQYAESIVEFERFARYSADIKRIETARFRVCQSRVRSLQKYTRDQSGNNRAFESLQDFLDDFPNSQFADEARNEIVTLREKMARKEYEAARLYLKLEEFESARVYFDSVLQNFYDTSFADKSRRGLIFSYILEKRREKAQAYFDRIRPEFQNEEIITEVEIIFENTAEGKLSLDEYILLYK